MTTDYFYPVLPNQHFQTGNEASHLSFPLQPPTTTYTSTVQREDVCTYIHPYIHQSKRRESNRNRVISLLLEEKEAA